MLSFLAYFSQDYGKVGWLMKIFNMYQADVFVQHGCRVKRILKIDGKQCIIFHEDKIFNECITRWRDRSLSK